MNNLTRRRTGAFIGAGLLALAGGGIARPGWAAGTARAANTPETHRITIRRFRFEPETLTIRAGDKVEWRNLDFAPHTATSKGGAWDTGSLAKNEANVVAFNEAGRHAYYCIHHPHMTGEIIVAEPK